MKHKNLSKAALCICLTLLTCISLCSCKSSTHKKVPDIPVTDASQFKCQFSDNGETCSITAYVGTDKEVNIPEEIDGHKVVAIEIGAFLNNNTLERIIIPDSVKQIWQNAFWGCIELKEVTFGDNITFIGGRAFKECISLQEINLPKKLEKMEASVFEGCKSAKKITVPATLTNWGAGSFFGCSAVEEVVLEDGLKTIQYQAFASAKLKSITIPASVEFIGSEAFLNNKTPIESIKFLGDAPEAEGKVFGEPNKDITIQYKKGTKGWDSSSLAEDYTLKAY